MTSTSQTRPAPGWRRWAPVALLMLGWFLIGWFARGWLAPRDDPEVALVRQAGYIIANGYYGALPAPREMTYAAIRGMLASTGDKYAAFYEPLLAVHDGETMRGNGAVIGVKGEMQAGAFVLVSVFPGEPAALAGLLAGDRVLAVDGWVVKPDSAYMDVMTMIRGPIGSTAHVQVARGDRTLEFDVPRRPYREVITQTLGTDIAYLRFDLFTEQTPQAVDAALRELLAAEPHGLVVDLRHNGGGLMNSTRAVLDQFLDEGVAFHARTKDGTLMPFATRSGDMAERIPLVVLVSHDTYSAGETMAAALADRGRGTLIGETTHGKGAIKDTQHLADGSSLQFTVAEWLSPVSRASYEGRGVPPDIALAPDPASVTDAVLEYAAAYLRRQ